MEVVVAILMPIILVISFYSFVFYSTHIDMVKSRTKIYGYANYKKFIEHFNKYNWEQDKYYKLSLFDYHHNCQIHVSIIEFDGIGMIMRTPLDYFLANRYLRWYIRQNHKTKLYQW